MVNLQALGDGGVGGDTPLGTIRVFGNRQLGTGKRARLVTASWLSSNTVLICAERLELQGAEENVGIYRQSCHGSSTLMGAVL